ncbi:MAG: SRPBCC family protein [Gammaproteobacteria bacterium]|nr:SRPBCC family protein [Gammaproteobacteria bacterium]NKC11671.1 SRPBCC family protein [Gammaproteobacteria bacterium]
MARVYVSSLINAPAPKVWARVRDFNGLPSWHPAIARSRIEDGRAADQVGCVRNFTLTDGAPLREQLLALSDYDLLCTYSILQSPMPLTDYVATLRLTPVTDGDRTFIEWTAEFECAADDEAGLTAAIGSEVFQAGFDALKRHFAAQMK